MFRLEYFVSGKWLLAITVATASSRAWSQETESVPPPPPVVHKLQITTSPVEFLRELLAMKPEQREKALAGEPPAKKEIWARKISEYEAMSPEERELRLRMTQLRWYLVPLMESSLVERNELLARIPEQDKPLIERRLKLWDRIPVQVQKNFLENELHLGYLMKLRGTTAGERAKMLETFPPDRRQRLERDLAKWNSLPDRHREEMSARFNQFFDLDEREKSKILANVSTADRKQMEKTLKSMENLAPEERRQYIEAFHRFAEMTPEERKQFLRNAERWHSMSFAEQQAWRALVQKSLPPPPPPPLPPGVKTAPPLPPPVAQTNAPR